MPLLASAQVTKIIHVTTAGTLSSLLTANEKANVTNFTITGTINAVDFQTIRDNMPAVAILDISAATIGAYNDMWNPIPANEIPESAFSFFDITKKYSNLTNIHLPATITKIGRNAFNSCTGLTSIAIPDGVTSIGNGAFWGCTALQSVVIPASVAIINDVAFSGCTALSSITVKAATPIAFGLYVTPFVGVNKNTCTLYVPVGSQGLYNDANQWKEFINIVELNTTLSNSLTKADIQFYPNPTTNVLHISGVEKNTQIEIYNVAGKLIKSHTLNTGFNSIDISTLPKGVYLLRGVVEGEKWVGRFVKE